MTEPFRPDDELVSAVLDGEATVEERARVLGDPVLAARLAEFEAVADAVGGPVATRSEAARDSALTAAVAARDRRPDPVVRPLRPRRSPGPLLAAAAVLALVVGAGVLLSRAGDDRGQGDGAALDAGESSDEESGGGAEESAEGGEDSAAPEADAFDPTTDAGDLGALADPEAVAAALERAGAVTPRAEDGATSSPTTGDDGQLLDEASGDTVDCQIALEEADPALAGLLARATATYQGTPAVVLVFSTVEGAQRVVVVRADACAPLTTVDL